MELIRKLLRSGIQDGMSYRLKRSLLVSNYISLILSVAILAVWIFRTTVYVNTTVSVNWLIGFAVFAVPVFFNGLGLISISRLFLCSGPILFIWYAFISNMLAEASLELSHFDGIRVYLLALSFIPYLLFDRTRPILLAVAILPTFLSVVFFENILEFYNVSAAQRGIVTGPDFPVMWMRTLIAYGIISAGCFTFQSIMLYNDRLNEKLLQRLRVNGEEIDNQNRLLKQQRDELNRLNAHLEELVDKKTKNIQEQNEMLVRYSFTNAHKVRGPVARILGLIQMSKMKSGLEFPWIFEKVENETRCIDQILHGISRELNETVRHS